MGMPVQALFYQMVLCILVYGLLGIEPASKGHGLNLPCKNW